jgi:glycine dehydrogenase subunit 1
LKFSGPTFNEFVIEIEKESEPIIQELTAEKILGGVPLKRFYPELDRHLLVTVTEMNKKEEIDRWAEVLERAIK